MNAPSSRHLSFDFEAYKGLTLRELFMIVSITTLSSCLIGMGIGWVLHWMVALSCLGFLLGFILAITLLPSPIAKLKHGKPHGYLKKELVLTLCKYHLKKSPYIHYVGIWQRKLNLRKVDV